MVCTIAECPGYTEAHEDEAQLRQKVLSQIMQLIAEGCTDFYMNSERGVPLLAAEAVCMLRQRAEIRLHLMIPHEEQCRNWTEYDRDRYYAVHALADTVTFVRTQFSPYCYQEADRRMAEQSDVIVVFGSSEGLLQIKEFAQTHGLALRLVG